VALIAKLFCTRLPVAPWLLLPRKRFDVPSIDTVPHSWQGLLLLGFLNGPLPSFKAVEVINMVLAISSAKSGILTGLNARAAHGTNRNAKIAVLAARRDPRIRHVHRLLITPII
jgi:hypothetical protein